MGGLVQPEEMITPCTIPRWDSRAGVASQTVKTVSGQCVLHSQYSTYSMSSGEVHLGNQIGHNMHLIITNIKTNPKPPYCSVSEATALFGGVI